MSEEQYQKAIAEQIEAKYFELDKVLEEMAGDSIEQKALKCIVIERLRSELHELIHLYRYEETPPSKEDILSLIDQALDEQNREEFMRLTTLLNDMNKK